MCVCKQVNSRGAHDRATQLLQPLFEELESVQAMPYSARGAQSVTPADSEAQKNAGREQYRKWAQENAPSASGVEMASPVSGEQTTKSMRNSLQARRTVLDAMARQRTSQDSELHREIDTSQDSKISKEEWQARFGNQALFDTYDANHDGSVSADEWQQAHHQDVSWSDMMTTDGWLRFCLATGEHALPDKRDFFKAVALMVIYVWTSIMFPCSALFCCQPLPLLSIALSCTDPTTPDDDCRRVSTSQLLSSSAL